MKSVKKAGNEDSKTSFHFLPIVTTINRSRREIELSHASAKSHLAKLSHRQRDNAGHQPSKPVDILPSACSLSMLFPTNEGGLGEESVRENPIHEQTNHRSSDRSHDARVIAGDSAFDSQILALGVERSQSDEILRRTRSLATRPRRLHQSLVQRSKSDPPLMCSPTIYRPEPWSTVSKKLSSRHNVHQLQYCLTTLWPGYGPGTSSIHTPEFTLSWAALELEGSTLFNALMWHAAVHLSIKRRSPIMEHESLGRYQQAIRNLSQELQNPVDIIDESTIFAVLCLITPEVRLLEDTQAGPMGLDSPFSDLYWLSIHGSQPFVESHIQAFFKLIDLKGGIDSLQMSGLAAAAQYADVIYGTFKLSQPHFPVARVFMALESPYSRDNSFGFTLIINDDESSKSLATDHTLVLEELVHHGLSHDVYEVMEDLNVWTRLLTSLRRNSTEKTDLSLLTLRRSLIQHKLLRTMPLKEGPSTGFRVTGLVQIGLLIFTIGATFPIRDPQLHQELAEQLSAQLQRSLCKLLDMNLHRFLIWLCMLGCLAAARSGDEVLRSWFIDTICHVAGIMPGFTVPGLTTASEIGEKTKASRDTFAETPFDIVRDIYLAPYLWYEEACDSVAQAIWVEVQRELRRI